MDTLDFHFVDGDEEYSPTISFAAPLYYTFDTNQLGVLTIAIPVSTAHPLGLTINAYGSKLEVENCALEEYLASKYQINILGKPKVSIFSSAT